jgi:cytoskeletal protein CcmA (bactofilin family)
VVTYPRRFENTATAEARAQESLDQTSRAQSAAQEHEPVLECSTLGQKSVPRVPVAESETCFDPPGPILALTPPLERGRKIMLVPEGITLRGGDILGCRHMAIEGEAYLKIDHCDKLEVSQNGIFEGSASVLEAEISGLCKGTLVVKGTLRIMGTGHVIGSIQYGYLQVEGGGRIEGEMKIPVQAREIEPQTPPDKSNWVDLNTKLSA